jgi:hypothetical protein
MMIEDLRLKIWDHLHGKCNAAQTLLTKSRDPLQMFLRSKFVNRLIILDFDPGIDANLWPLELRDLTYEDLRFGTFLSFVHFGRRLGGS